MEKATRKANAKKCVYLFLTIVICLQLSCKRLVEVSAPITSLTNTNTYNNDATAAAVLTGLYANWSNGSNFCTGTSGISLLSALSADDLRMIQGASNTTYVGYYTNRLTNVNVEGSDMWSGIYPFVGVANSALEGIESSSGLTAAVKQQLTGEAKFVRAFCYFYLVNLYGDVPLTLTSNYTVNSVLARSPEDVIWQQVISDLKDAEGLLSGNYLDATLLNTTNERVRPSKWAAAALLARAYLYTTDYSDAESQADTVLGNSGLFALSSLNNAFLRASLGNNEAIWQLQPVNVGQNSPDASVWIIPSSGPDPVSYPFYLNSDLINAFDSGDQRRVDWIDSVSVGAATYYYPFKYKVDSAGAPLTEYTMVLRLGELYLIRAEARIQLGNLAGAMADINVIRERAGLADIGDSSVSALMNIVRHERRVELFTEWGHRWLDMKRTGVVDSVMGTAGACAAKGGIWNPDWALYPISLYELQTDAKLVQNPGY